MNSYITSPDGHAKRILYFEHFGVIIQQPPWRHRGGHQAASVTLSERITLLMVHAGDLLGLLPLLTLERARFEGRGGGFLVAGPLPCRFIEVKLLRSHHKVACGRPANLIALPSWHPASVPLRTAAMLGARMVCLFRLISHGTTTHVWPRSCSAMIRANSAGLTIAVPSNAGARKWRLLPVTRYSARAFWGALKEPVIGLLRCGTDPLRGTDHGRGTAETAKETIDSSGIQSEFRTLEDLGVFFEDRCRKKKPHLLGHSQREQRGRNTAGLEGGGHHDIGVIDNLQGHALERGSALRPAAISRSISSASSRENPPDSSGPWVACHCGGEKSPESCRTFIRARRIWVSSGFSLCTGSSRAKAFISHSSEGRTRLVCDRRERSRARYLNFVRFAPDAYARVEGAQTAQIRSANPWFFLVYFTFSHAPMSSCKTTVTTAGAYLRQESRLFVR